MCERELETRVDWVSRAVCVEIVWRCGGNGGGPVGEENSGNQWKRCEEGHEWDR